MASDSVQDTGRDGKSSEPHMAALTEQNASPSPMASSHPTLPNEFLSADGHPDYTRLILTSRVYEVMKETPLNTAVGLSTRYGSTILLKREDLTPVFSFKLRGAYNRMANMTQEEKWRGVVACSAGNHAQGVAFSAKCLGIPASIVMPTGTPSIKHRNVTRMGAKVILHGNDFDDAQREAARLCQMHALTNIPPFDDPWVVAGQGTIAMELLRQTDVNKLKAVFCCVGGGGLIAGIGTYIKRIAPHVKVIGCETYDADAMHRSLASGNREILKEVGLFADGAAVRQVGSETFRVARSVIDEVIKVSTDEICAAIKDVFEETRSIVEPAGALAVAGLKQYLSKRPTLSSDDKSYCAVLSGANMNFDRLRFVTERADLGLETEVFFYVSIPDRPGTFVKLQSIISPRLVTEFSYRHSDSGPAGIFLSFKVTNRSAEVPDILSKIHEVPGFEAQDISENELAKSHARYMIGGKSDAADERLFSFEFPERPGALDKFLNGLRSDWNITLFHYRNQGGDIAKVLVGIQVPDKEMNDLNEFLQRLGYPVVDESDNFVYKRLLKK